MEERRFEPHLERIIITEALKRILGIHCAGGGQLNRESCVIIPKDSLSGKQIKGKNVI